MLPHLIGWEGFLILIVLVNNFSIILIFQFVIGVPIGGMFTIPRWISHYLITIYFCTSHFTIVGGESKFCKVLGSSLFSSFSHEQYLVKNEIKKK
jgi:hypothetical protein